MQFFYDGQIRRYLLQTIRVLSNFVVKYGDGTLVQVPVVYGDMDRQSASILRQNSENKVNAAPRIAVYISALDLDKDRLSDSTFVGKLHIRERDIDNSNPSQPTYTAGQGRNYTVERLMPTPFKLTMKCDIWSTSTEQKLQILEQILVLFNPSLELQTTDNYIDWTSLSTLTLTGTNWSSRTVPVGNDSPIDIATLTFETPIWISPPVKIKHLGVITNIITSLYSNADTYVDTYIDGLGQPTGGTTTTMSGLLARQSITGSPYPIAVYGQNVTLLKKSWSEISNGFDVPDYTGLVEDWSGVLESAPGKFIDGSSQIYLTQPDGVEIVGTISINPLDGTILTANWDIDTLKSDTLIDSNGLLMTDQGFDQNSARGKFDRIIDPLQQAPGANLPNPSIGDRFLIIEDIGSEDNTVPATAWGNLIAYANDIIEWDGTQWNVIFNSNQESDTIVWQTNIYTGVQFKWVGNAWVKSFEGEYLPGQWRIEL
jgi:hypothetical protein